MMIIYFFKYLRIKNFYFNMDRKSLLRIVNDLNDLQENRPEGIYLYINKKNF